MTKQEAQALVGRATTILGCTEDALIETAAQRESSFETLATSWKRYWKQYGILHPKVRKLAEEVCNDPP